MTDLHFKDLLVAIDKNDIAAVSSLIANGALSERDAAPPPLVVAARLGRVEIMAMLLDAGAPIDAANEWRQCACHASIAYAHLPALQLLVARGANLAAVDISGGTPFGYAGKQETDQFLITLLDADVSLYNATDDELVRAATKSVRVLTRLLQRKINVRKLLDSSGRTPCHVVINGTSENCKVLDALIDLAGVNVNARDRRGFTPCHYAIMSQDIGALRILLEYGAEIDLVDLRVNVAPLHSACLCMDSGNAPVVEFLLAAGANVHLVNKRGETACHAAALHDMEQSLVCLLVAAGADLDRPDNSGVTPRQLIARSTCSFPTTDEVDAARRRIARRRLDFVRERALQVCIGLQPLDLDALRLCEIMLHSCGALAKCVPFHQFWAIAVKVKHFRAEMNQSDF
jgi:ankyrin repeat protein